MLLLFPAGTFIATAEESTTVTAQEAGMNITGVIELNGSPLTSGTEVRNGDVISLDVNWTLPNDFEYVNGTFTYDLTGKLYGISLADIIIPLSEVAAEFMKPDGLFISSGIIYMKQDEVCEALEKNGFKIVEICEMGEWRSIVARIK